MAMSFKRILLCGAVIAPLTACNTIGYEDPGFAEAVKYDAAIQTINPAPVYAANSAQPGDNGEKGALAVKRYRTDTVKGVETMQTTAGSSDSGSSGSGSGYTPH
jgi:hypothetical protein